MADTNARWFEVIAGAELALKVLARDKDEAEKLFWEEYEEDIDMMLLHPGFFDVTSVNECEPDADE
jgi:hypothetical protein